MSFLDFLFPKFCVDCRHFGSYLCSDCFAKVSFSESGFCTVCQKAAIGGLTHPICRKPFTIDGVFSSLAYKGVVKKLVYQFKYKPYLRDLQDVLVEFFYEGLIQKEGLHFLLQEKSVLVPIPLHKTKLRQRGYNQAYLLAEGLGQKFSVPVIDCLERVKSTKTQVGLSQIERQENIKGAFAVKKAYTANVTKFRQIFLIDDVVTSGATLAEVAKVLKKAGGGSVWGITLAHGQ